MGDASPALLFHRAGITLLRPADTQAVILKGLPVLLERAFQHVDLRFVQEQAESHVAVPCDVISGAVGRTVLTGLLPCFHERSVIPVL